MINKGITVFEIRHENAGGVASSAQGSLLHLKNEVLASSTSLFLPPPSWKNVGTGEAVISGAIFPSFLENSVTVAGSSPSPVAMSFTSHFPEMPYGRPI